MANALIIDDDKLICHAISNLVSHTGNSASYCLRLEQGLEQLCSGNFDIVFLDVCLPDGNGLKMLSEIRRAPSLPEVIVITGEGAARDAETAIKNGAWDYIQKPLSIEDVRIHLIRALQYREEKKAKIPRLESRPENIIGSSNEMKRCFNLLAQAAHTDTNVLITGETGTGKELFARAIHTSGFRSKKSFVVVDCAALPSTLVESILFGHKKGAFTGADKDKIGLLKQADGGTLFLDEVGELPPEVQKKFLRALQERKFRPVGGKEEQESNFRLIAATNRSLEAMEKNGRFRKDLLYRLKTTTIDLPALKDRKEDIKDIALYYINQFCAKPGQEIKGVSPEFIETLTAYSWPGNVRQLIHSVESALAKAVDESTLYPIHLPDEIRVQLAHNILNSKTGSKINACKNSIDKTCPPDHRTWMQKMEKQYLEEIIDIANGKMKDACRISGLPHSSFYFRLKKHDICRPS